MYGNEKELKYLYFFNLLRSSGLWKDGDDMYSIRTAPNLYSEENIHFRMMYDEKYDVIFLDWIPNTVTQFLPDDLRAAHFFQGINWSMMEDYNLTKGRFTREINELSECVGIIYRAVYLVQVKSRTNEELHGLITNHTGVLEGIHGACKNYLPALEDFSRGVNTEKHLIMYNPDDYIESAGADKRFLQTTFH